MRRREFLLAGSAALCSFSVYGQQARRGPRIGYLGATSASDRPPLLATFRQGLRELGWIEGQNIVIDYRFAEGRLDRLPDLAAELVHLKVDIIVSLGTQGVTAARNATKTIPIVMIGVRDPVGIGLIASLAPRWKHHRGLRQRRPGNRPSSHRPKPIEVPVLAMPNGFATTVRPGWITWEKNGSFRAETQSDLMPSPRIRQTYRFGSRGFAIVRVEAQPDGPGEWTTIWDAPPWSFPVKPK